MKYIDRPHVFSAPFSNRSGLLSPRLSLWGEALRPAIRVRRSASAAPAPQRAAAPFVVRASAGAASVPAGGSGGAAEVEVDPFAANPAVSVSKDVQQRFTRQRLFVFFGILIG